MSGSDLKQTKSQFVRPIKLQPEVLDKNLLQKKFFLMSILI